MSAVSKIRRGYNMTNPTSMKSDNGKGTDLNASPAVKVRSTGTSGWNMKQPKTDTGTNKSGGKMDKGTGLSTMGSKQPQTSKSTAAQGGKMTGNQSSLNTWGMKQTKKDSGISGIGAKTVKTNFPLGK